MDRIRSLFKPQQRYEPVDHYRDDAAASEDGSDDDFESREKPFLHIEYWIFLLMGVAMLWAWNMFLAAAPYFQVRFSSDKWILAHFQSAEISVSTVTNLVAMLALTKLQKKASYPYRVLASLSINIITFTLLALSTLVPTSAGVYFGFLMLMMFSASLATALCQNGVFAYVSGFGRSEYMQAIMTGQAVAGVLPCLVQIGSVLAVPKKEQESSGAPPPESSKSAFAYFLTATGVCVVSFIAFLYLLRRRRSSSATQTIQAPSMPKVHANGTTSGNAHTDPPASPDPQNPLPHPKTTDRKSIPLTHLLLKLPSLSTAIFLCFAITMVFPVFTASIPSLNPSRLPSSLFIPLATLIWSSGDLIGRLTTLWPAISLTHYPFALFCLAVARLVFIPLYLLCNVGGHGAKIPSDLFYLIVVQLLFGISNGYLGSSCMMGAGEWVNEDEKEAAGGYMGLCLVAGLTVGSLLSFLVGGI